MGIVKIPLKTASTFKMNSMSLKVRFVGKMAQLFGKFVPMWGIRIFGGVLLTPLSF